MENHIRSFIAIPCNSRIQNKVSSLQKRCKDIPCQVKWVDPQNVHLTLQFLGDLSEGDLKEVSRILGVILRGIEPFEVSLTHLGGFPSLDRPRTLWIGLKDPGQKLARLSSKVRKSTLQLNIEPDKKHFVPHLTVGRVKSIEGNHPFKSLARDDLAFSGTVMSVNRVNLYKSTLTTDGPDYKVIHSFHL